MKKGKRKAAPYLQEITPAMAKEVDERMDEFTANLIDLPMYEFCRKLADKTYGELKVIRLYLEDRLFEVNNMCTAATNKLTLHTSVPSGDVATYVNLHAVLVKIDDRRGFLDHLLTEKQLQQ